MNKENKQVKFKLRKTAAYGLASCLFVAGLALAPNPAHAAEGTNTPVASEIQTAVITIHVTDKTTGETKTFTAEQRVGDYINVPEIITLVYPKNQYHSDWSQTYMTKPSDNVWNITVEKYAENPYEILPSEKVDVKRTINITYPDGTKDTIVQTAEKYRTRRKVVATGEIEVSPWRFPPQTSYWNDFTAKKIEGYTANIPYLKTVGEPSEDAIVNISYTANQKNVSGIIQFTSDGKVVGKQAVSGIQGKSMSVTLNIPMLYKANKPTMDITLTKDNDIITIPVEHNIVRLDDETKTYTRMIILKVPGRDEQKIEQTLTAYRSRIRDLVTNETIPTSPWIYMEQWPEYVLPIIDGYKAPTVSVEKGIAPTQDETVVLTYTKINNSETKPSTGTSTDTSTKPEVKPSTGTSTDTSTKPDVKPSTGASTDTSTKPEVKPSTGTSTDTSTKPEVKPSTGSSTDTRTKPEVKPSTGSSTDTSTKPEVKPSTGSSTDTNTKPDVKPSTGTSTDTSTKPEVKPSTGTSTDTSTKPETKPSTGTNTSTKPETKPSTGTNTSTKPSTGTSTDTSTKPETKPSTGTSTDTSTKPETKPSTGTGTTTNTSTKPEVKPSTGTTTNTSTKPEVKPSTGTSTNTSTKPEVKPSTGTTTNTSTKPEVKPSTGTSTNTSTKPEVKPSTGTSTDTSTKSEVKPSTGTSTKPNEKPSVGKNTTINNQTTKNLPKKLDKEEPVKLPQAGTEENAWLAILGMGSIVGALGVSEINRRKNL